MLRKIKVYGALRKFLNWETGTFLADISNVAEVGRFLVANWPDIEQHMQDQHYKIFVGNYNIGEEELNYPIGQTEEIRIVPVAVGAGGGFRRSWWGKVIIGAALIVAAPAFSGMSIGTFGVGAGSIAVSTIVAGVGVSLALGGVVQLLTPDQPVPSTGSEMDPQSNYSFSGIQNVSRAGVPLKICYGYEIFTGSVTISNQIDTVQVDGTA